MLSLENICGFSQDAAFKIVRQYGHTPRVTKLECVAQKLDGSVDPNRCNLEIEHGKVVKAYFG